MKSTLKVCDMFNQKDVYSINRAISNNQGVIACQIIPSSKEVEIVYDDYFITLDEIMESIEEAGYTVL